MYGGRMRLVNRRRSPSWSVRRSFTRGALTGIVPAPTVTPSRVTRQRRALARLAPDLLRPPERLAVAARPRSTPPGTGARLVREGRHHLGGDRRSARADHSAIGPGL